MQINTYTLPQDFDYKMYLKLNPDLHQKSSKEEAISHYINFGSKEGRKYKINVVNNINIVPDDFDYKIYLKLNPDLSQKASKNDVFYHYIHFGRKERRPYKINFNFPNDFDVVLYAEVNNIINYNFENYDDKIEILLHFYHNKSKIYKPITSKNSNDFDENKFYNIQTKPVIPNFFKWKDYISINKDLSSFNSEKDAIHHFLNYGFYEKRNFYIKKSLLYDFFQNNNKDLNLNLFYICSEKIKNNEIYNLYFKNTNETNLSFLKFETPLINKIGSEAFKQIIPHHNSVDYSDLNNLLDETNIIQTDKNYIDISFLSLFDNFILIIDAPENITGGTRFFINSIINKFKQTSFLILTIDNLSNKTYKLNINNKFYFKNSFNEDEILTLLNENECKIAKIFINHFIYYPTIFYKKILSINKHKTIITHDPILVTENFDLPHILIDDFCKSNFTNDNLSLIDSIITQNKKNCYLFSNIKNLNQLIVSNLPDYFLTEKKIESNNSNIIVAIVGAISNVKGSELVKLLFDFYQNTNITIVVFGAVSNFSNSNVIPYSNIDDLNNLFIKYKPNLILETSLWPETYSYTLTISMLTNLPIISLEKYFDGVIKDRLNSYDKTYYFKNLNELTTLIRDKKQDYFYTIKPLLYFNNFWTSYFNYYETYFQEMFGKYNLVTDNIKNNIIGKNIVLITSKIYVNTKASFSYSKSRSIYSDEERFLQTLNTIDSVRRSIPNSYIVLVDNSIFDNLDWFQQLSNNVDTFINITDNPIVNYYTNICIYKFTSDLTHQILFYNSFFKYCINCEFKHFFKISGRYFLNDNFNYKLYDNDKNIFKQNKNVKDREYFYTSFYKINKNYLNFYFQSLEDIFNNKFKYFNKDLEVIFGEYFKNDMTLNENLGVTQLYSCWKYTDDV